MVWKAMAGAVVWYASTWSACLSRPVPLPAPKAPVVVPRSDWAYEALSKLGAAGREISSKKLQAGSSLTKDEFATVVAYLVDQAARREKSPPAMPMSERVLLARLVAVFGGGPAAAGVRGLSPATVSSRDGSSVALFTPTPDGAAIDVIDTATQQATRVSGDGYNYGPTWSSDGDELAWLSYAEGRTIVWVVSRLDGDQHMVGSFLNDAWGSLTVNEKGYILSVPGREDRLVRIPAHMEPENGGPKRPSR